MKIMVLISVGLCIVILSSCEDNKYKSVSEYGQFAPPDAFEEDSLFAYYGSENEWNRRMFSEKAAKNQYKRIGQRLLLFVLDGDQQIAIEECKKILADNPNDLEALFVLTIAYCNLNDIEMAWIIANSAIKKGLLLERFLAGPRELLKPLYMHSEFQKLVRKKGILLLHGPMLGSVTQTSVKIWIRTANESEAIIEYYDEMSKGISIKEEIGYSKNETDYTVVFELNNLEPSTKYYYNIIIDGIVFTETKSFSTLSKKNMIDSITIAFGGGAGYTPDNERMWDVIDSFQPDALMLLGDNVYIDLPKMPGSFHDYTYYRRQSRPEFRNVVSSVPVYTIWDDHDAGTDDVWLGPYINKPDWKLPMLNHFKRQWVNPAYGLNDNPGCYYNFSIGAIDFFMLDCRFYRTNPFQENKTMLGPIQKEWLKKSLLKSEGKIKLLVSSVPWSSRAKPGSKDTWDGFSKEREEIFSFIEENKIEGVVLIAADRHRSDAWKIKRQNGYDLYELQSSKLTNLHTHEIIPESIIGYNEKCSFGLIHFTDLTYSPKLKYEIVNIEGEVVDSLVIDYQKLKIR